MISVIYTENMNKNGLVCSKSTLLLQKYQPFIINLVIVVSCYANKSFKESGIISVVDSCNF